MKMKTIFRVACVFLCLAAIAAGSFTPEDGFVPNQETAVKIAVAVWEPIYGATQIAEEKPYQVRLTNGVWMVEGSLPKNVLGGVAEAWIAKTDGRILKVSHGQ